MEKVKVKVLTVGGFPLEELELAGIEIGNTYSALRTEKGVLINNLYFEFFDGDIEIVEEPAEEPDEVEHIKEVLTRYVEQEAKENSEVPEEDPDFSKPTLECRPDDHSVTYFNVEEWTPPITPYHMQVLGVDVKTNKPTRTWIDAYSVLNEIEASEQVKHTIKKLLAHGQRSGGKSKRKDIEECIQQLKYELYRMDKIENS